MTVQIFEIQSFVKTKYGNSTRVFLLEARAGDMAVGHILPNLTFNGII